jgi:hypothetical protein
MIPRNIAIILGIIPIIRRNIAIILGIIPIMQRGS